MNNINIEHVFVINLKHRTDRWNKVQNDFKDTGLKLQRWDAVYGKDLNEKEITQKTTQNCDNFCTYGVIGCWLSHYTLWKYIADNNLNNVLILEDDAEPFNGFNDKIKSMLKNIPTDYDLIYIGCFNVFDIKSPYKSLLKDKDVIINNKKIDDLIIPHRPLGMHGYLMSNNGARKLTEYKELTKVSHDIDIALSDYVYGDEKKDFKMYAFKEPLIIQQSDANKSDLTSNDHPIINYILSKIVITTGIQMGYLTSIPFYTLRKYNLRINSLSFIFIILSFIIGLFCSHTTIRTFIFFIYGLFCVEFMMTKNKNINQLFFELFIIMLFVRFGICFNKNYYHQ